MRWIRLRGFALIYVLMILAIVVMFVGALLTRTGSQALSGSLNFSQYQAQNAAEAGLADAVAQMEQSSTWTTGFSGKPLPGGGGSYTVHFSASESVNNLNSVLAANSRRGPNGVPPGAALVVVEGHYGGATRTLEAVLVPGLGIPRRQVLGATGRIDMSGDLYIDGMTSLQGPTKIAADIHSNQKGVGNHVLWSGGTILQVSGQVSSSGSTAAAIDLSGATGISTSVNAPQVRFNRPNITTLIGDHVADAGPPLPVIGSVTLSSLLNYYSGSQVIDGDLTLQNGAKVYVEHDLTVRGSVRGDGALIVGGNTSLHGDFKLDGGPDDYVSLLSKGHVTLEGFQGNTYLNTFAASNPTTAGQWDDLQYGLAQTKAIHDAHPTDLDSFMASNDAYMDGFNRIIGRAAHAVQDHYRADGTVREKGTAYSLMNSLPTVDPLNPSRDITAGFLRDRMQRLDDIYRDGLMKRDGTPSGWNPSVYMEDWFNGTWDGSLGGIYDAVQSSATSTHSDQVLADMVTQTEQFDYNRIGTAQFKGLVYTEGAFVAQNEVQLLGAVVVNGDPTQGTLVMGSDTYQPGDLIVKVGSSFTYVDDMFRNGNPNLRQSGLLSVNSWVIR